MPRKFRYTRSKNWECKKQQKKKQLQELKVNEPLNEPPGLSQAPINSLDELYSRIPKLDASWSDQTSTTKPINKLKFCKISSQPSTTAQPLVVTHSLIVNPDFSWEVFVYGHKVTPTSTNPLSSIPPTIDAHSLLKLISVLECARICPGNPDAGFITLAEAHRGRFLSNSGEVKDSLESGFPIVLNGEFYANTIRTSGCELLTHQSKCSSCKNYRAQLRAMQSRLRKKNNLPKKCANDRYLNTPQRKKKLAALKARCLIAESELHRLKWKIQESTDTGGIVIDELLHHDLYGIMEEKNDVKESFLEGTFRRLFWDEQLKTAQVSDSRQMRWHPMMIKWCLNLKLLSSSAYNSLRSSGFIKLPSERTLRDYTHFFQSKCGFQQEVDAMLLKEASIDGLPDWKRYVVILFDELKLRESLVYDKHSTQAIGFVHLGDMDNQIKEFENDGSVPPIATHMLCLMVRGVFNGIRFPYVHFSTTEVTGASLFSIVWEAIEGLERLGFKVVGLTGDGASPNSSTMCCSNN